MILHSNWFAENMSDVCLQQMFTQMQLLKLTFLFHKQSIEDKLWPILAPLKVYIGWSKRLILKCTWLTHQQMPIMMTFLIQKKSSVAPNTLQAVVLITTYRVLHNLSPSYFISWCAAIISNCPWKYLPTPKYARHF